MYKFYVSKNSKGEWYLKLVSSNGNTIIWSEGYSSKQGAVDAVNLVKTYGPNAPIYEV